MKKLTNPWSNIPGYFCFGCAPENKAGVRMNFYSDGEEVVSVWKPEQQFQGWLDTLHGGIQAVMLDEICAWVVMRNRKATGVTSKMETRYIKPISTKDTHLIIRAREVQRRRNLITIDAEIYNSAGEVCSKAQCLYFTFPPKNSLVEYMPQEEEEISLEEIIASL